jgi:quinol monooxygenase YgiN
MTIHAANSLEIRFFDPPDNAFESALLNCVDQLEAAPGCLGYALNRSRRETALWIMCGYWHSEAQMTEHFCAEPMTHLVNVLIEAGANLTFTSLVATAESAVAHAG